MASLINSINWGNAVRNENPELIRQLSEVYTRISLCVNQKSSKYVAEIDPPNTVTSSETNKTLEIGDFWVNKLTDSAWIMTSRTTDLLVTWKLIT
jgi:hypothetical protein